jgi:predicted dehydrogenase
MPDTIRWGIISTGWIAHKFATGLSVLPDAKLVAVGSRSQDSAKQFGDQYGVPKRHASYEALANDPEVDIVYIGTPHPMHRQDALMCLAAGKPVLCEKPFTLNAIHTKEVIGFARQKKLYLMEAMWTRFIPAIVKVRELITDGAIGEVQMVQADFGYHAPFDPLHRAYNPELGGGALLDVGIYPIAMASMVFGKQPSQISSHAYLGKTGTDDFNGMIFQYDGGQIAVLSSSIALQTPSEVAIIGTKGYIRIHYPFWFAHRITLSQNGKGDQEMVYPLRGNGYDYEAEAVMADLRAGRLENAIMPLDESLAIMETMDLIRAQWGLRYPGE